MRLIAEKIKKDHQTAKKLLTAKRLCATMVLQITKEEFTMVKTASKLAYDIWEASGVSQKKLAEKMGLKTQQAVFNMLKAKNGMRVDNFVRMMNVLGYDVVVRNKVTDEETMVSPEGVDAE